MKVALRWLPRVEAIPCAAVAAVGRARGPLCAAAARRMRRGADLRAAVDEEAVLITGAPQDLPWADGAVYLGWQSGLLVPTTVRPSVPVDVLRRVLSYQIGEIAAVFPGVVLIAPKPVRPATAALLESLA